MTRFIGGQIMQRLESETAMKELKAAHEGLEAA